MPFCTKCGNENHLGAKFCGACGTPQMDINSICPGCGKPTEPNQKYCSTCGSQLHSEEKKQPVSTSTENRKITKEGRKIISDVPKANNQKKVKGSTQQAKTSKKKRRSPAGCFFRTLFILFTIVLVSALAIVAVNWLFVEENQKASNSGQNIESTDDSGLTDTNIPGIVDIEPGDVSHLPENRNSGTEQTQSMPIKEDAGISKAAKKVEDAFLNADIDQIKLLLSESGLAQYSNVLTELQPHLPEYGKAFKKRKLVTSTEIYQVYEFYDEKGGIFSAAFELQPDGNWKLTRF